MSLKTPGDRLVAVGVVVKPHGVRGELCVDSEAQSPTLFAEAGRVYLRRGKSPAKEYAVAASRPHQDRVLLTLKGVADRDAAEALRGLEICVAAADLPAPGDDDIYLHELEGLTVLAEDGAALGTLEGFLLVAGQETWVVRHASGREILLPSDPQFVLDIDLEHRTARVAPPEGLLDLYLGDPS